MSQHILVTGGAGFIGSHLVEKLITDGKKVVCLDNFDPYYPAEIKHRNLASVIKHPNFQLIEGDLLDPESLASVPNTVTHIVHLAARAGVRPSIENPQAYYKTNTQGTVQMLDFAKQRGIQQFIYASSSSVYGDNPEVPWLETAAPRPISPYAASKAAAELAGKVASLQFGIRFIALRFFTVYGPRQRPDLAIHKFAKKMLAEESIPVFGDGSTRRDYTYVDDIIHGLNAALNYQDSNFEIINLGNHRTISLAELIQALESTLNLKANIQRLPEQSGDVPQTFASVKKAGRLLNYHPDRPLADGLANFIHWLKAS